MIIDHFCFAVKDLHKGIENWRKAFDYQQMTEIVTNSMQKVKVVSSPKRIALL